MTEPAAYDLVVAANRLPLHPPAAGRHGVGWHERADGEYSALRAATTTRHGAWVGSIGAAGPAGAASATTRFCHDELWLHPVPLSQQDADEHLHGHCASTLAPLYHGCVEPPAFKRRWREAYRAVNHRYASTVARIAAPGGVAWVHDYHLQLVPGQLRRLRGDLLVGFLLHAPLPPVELFMRMPMRTEIMSGLLGADLIGFQHPRAAGNFLVIARHMGLSASQDGVKVGNRHVAVGTFPVPVDVPRIRSLASDPAVRARAADIRAKLNRPRTVFLAVGHPDHPDGAEQRFNAYADLLADGRLDPEQTVLIQVTATDGDGSPRQERLRRWNEEQVGRINGTYARVGRPVLHYVHGDLDRHELVALYLAADVMLATPLQAGASLPAKEFVAARADGSGSVVLSEFTGTSADLPEAIIVNPHDGDALKAAMLAAAAQQAGSAAMRAMRERVSGDAEHWAGHFLSVLGGCVVATMRQTIRTRQASRAGQNGGRSPALSGAGPNHAGQR